MSRPVPARLAVATGAVLSSMALAATLGASPWPGVVAGSGSGADAVRIAPGVQQLAAATALPPTSAECRHLLHLSCYNPVQVEQAYDLPALYASGTSGQGQTIVIVDSFGSPTIRRDLTTFDKAFGLPDPPVLTIIAPAGKVPAYTPTHSREGWAGETTLDVEYAHTVAPGAALLLVETPTSEDEGTSGFPQIVTAERYVIDHDLGSVISQSFGATEETFPSRAELVGLRGAYTDAFAHHVTVLAGSGDDGASDPGTDDSDHYRRPVVTWPATDPLVTAVGGTTLHLDAAGERTSADTVWNDSYSKATLAFFGAGDGPQPLAGGGGRSVVFARPAYQDAVAAVAGAHRSVPDISMSGACSGAVDIYQSYPGATRGWEPICGTSEATPLFAGIVALADQVAGHPLGLVNPTLYALAAGHAPGIIDVTKGDNKVSFLQRGKRYSVEGFAAKAGYDLASGLGTIDAATFVPELAAGG